MKVTLEIRVAGDEIHGGVFMDREYSSELITAEGLVEQWKSGESSIVSAAYLEKILTYQKTPYTWPSEWPLR